MIWPESSTALAIARRFQQSEQRAGTHVVKLGHRSSNGAVDWRFGRGETQAFDQSQRGLEVTFRSK
jgi:hypothetical protein